MKSSIVSLPFGGFNAVEGVDRNGAGGVVERVAVKGDGEKSCHDGLLTDSFKFAPVQGAARYLNTAVRPLATFPLRVLYRCALPGHEAWPQKIRDV